MGVGICQWDWGGCNITVTIGEAKSIPLRFPLTGKTALHSFILALVLALIMSLSLMATAGAGSFQDVTDDNPYKTAIDILDELKVFQGFEDESEAGTPCGAMVSSLDKKVW